MIKTVNKYDFTKWEEEHNFDLNYSAMSALIRLDDISADRDIYSTVGKVIKEMADDDDIDNIRLHWYNNECVIITGYPDHYHSFVIDGCIYIH